MKNKLILALICLLASCQSYRAERKINKLKEWGYLKDSTITKYDTIRGWQRDTFIQFDTINKVDTIITTNNGIKVVTYIKWKERQVNQIVSQKDTIFEHKYTTKVIKEKCNKWDMISSWIFIIGLILSLLWIIGIAIYSIKNF
jgi:hypothetical protein